VFLQADPKAGSPPASIARGFERHIQAVSFGASCNGLVGSLNDKHRYNFKCRLMIEAQV
jgi:hypothetical protein